MNQEHRIQAGQARRLAEIRSNWEMWSAITDTSSWETAFFFGLLEQKDREIAELRQKLNRSTK